jgi:salicylate hydroxylase
MATRKISVVVAGGGIGGLTSSIALRRAGHSVTVLEKSTFHNEIGQALTLSPNGGRILRSLGLDFEKADIADYLGTHISNGTTLQLMAPAQNYGDYDKQFGLRFKTAYRIDLHSALVELASSPSGDGAPVKLVGNTSITDFDAEKGIVFTTDGNSFQADLVIAANGIHSTAASHINGSLCPPLDPSGTVVYRFAIPSKRILDDPDTAQLLSAGPGWCSFNVSPTSDRWLVRYYCRNNQICNFAMYALHTKEEAEKERLRFNANRRSL